MPKISAKIKVREVIQGEMAKYKKKQEDAVRQENYEIAAVYKSAVGVFETIYELVKEKEEKEEKKLTQNL